MLEHAVNDDKSSRLDAYNQQMNETDLALTIRCASPDEINRLQAVFSPNDFAMHHHARYAVQAAGKGVYLIAWHEDEPVGHFLLRWEGPESDASGCYPYPTPYLEAGHTRIGYRRRGVATQLIAAAESIARERGDRAIGLAVGQSDNPEARRLYETLGYRDWGQGDLLVSWNSRDAAGNEGIESEMCIYMFMGL